MQCTIFVIDYNYDSLFGTNEYFAAYNAYGVTVAEVEVDVLTGENEVLRVDVLYDCGQRYRTIKM